MTADVAYVSEWSFGLWELRSYDRRDGSSSLLASAHSREELDVKLALLGLETDWSSKAENYSVYPVREISK